MIIKEKQITNRLVSLKRAKKVDKDRYILIEMNIFMNWKLRKCPQNLISQNKMIIFSHNKPTTSYDIYTSFESGFSVDNET